MTPVSSVHDFCAELEVVRRSTAAEGVVILDLALPDTGDLPRWEPGAHIDLIMANGLTRQYSLCGDPADNRIWRVGVLREPCSRGGSEFVHDHLTVGSTVQVRGPRNHFALVDAPAYRFIAGGIGITPIMAMIEAVHRGRGNWTLLYGGRTRNSMAFAADLAERFPGRVTLWPQDERGLLDLDAVLGEPSEETLVYCCGPEALLSAVEQRCAHWPPGALHLERFAAKKQDAAGAPDELDSFEVVCERSGITVEVTRGQSILEALEAADVPVMASCYEGTCGTCEAVVVEGTPDHRDSVLSKAERDAGEVMMLCVSRCRSERLILDL